MMSVIRPGGGFSSSAKRLADRSRAQFAPQGSSRMDRGNVRFPSMIAPLSIANEDVRFS